MKCYNPRIIQWTCTCVFFVSIILSCLLKPFVTLDPKPNQKQNLHQNEEGYCDSNTCNALVEDLLYFIKLGEKEIKLCVDPNFTILIGLSGHGKSTLAQVLTASQDLLAVCDKGRNCVIQDSSELIGDTILPKTFFPNLVQSYGPREFFYDMPGFDDNRNTSIEIANTFFFKQVLAHGERIKIIVVVRQAALHLADKKSFISLMENVANLVKNPRDFDKGLKLVVNLAEYHKNEEELQFTITEFLKHFRQNMKPLISKPNQEAVAQLLDTFLTVTDTKYGNIGWMRTPIRSGFLVDDNLIQRDVSNLQQLVRKQTEFVPKLPTGFGFPLSAEAKSDVREAVMNTDKRILEKAQSLADLIFSDCEEMVNLIVDHGLTQISKQPQVFNTISSFVVKEDFSSKYSIEHILTFLKELNDLGLEAKYVNQIKLLKQLGSDLELLLQIDDSNRDYVFPTEWQKSFAAIRDRVNEYINEKVVEKITRKAYTSLDWCSTTVLKSIKESAVSSWAFLTDLDKLIDLKERIEEGNAQISKKMNNRNFKLSDFLDLNLKQYEALELSNSRVVTALARLTKEIEGLKELEIFGTFNWNAGHDWAKPTSELFKKLNTLVEQTISSREKYTSLGAFVAATATAVTTGAGIWYHVIPLI